MRYSRTLPGLHFDVVGVYRGESLLVINYRNERGGLVNEVLTFDGGLVREGHGTYLHTYNSSGTDTLANTGNLTRC